MNIRALIQELQETEEQTRIEAKVASDVGTSILETICAFANEPGLGGGYLLLGVRRVEATLFDGPAYEVVGVRQPEKLSEDLTAQCSTVFNRQVRVRIFTEKVGEHTVLGVQVPEAQPGEKPIYFKRRGLPEGAVMDDLPVAFSLSEGSLQRTETPPIPCRVLREAIVNALMHRSYREHSPIQIIRYSNRIEILNPGYSLKPQELLGEPRSETRNPVLAAVLHETRFAETKGSGIGVMRRLMKASSLSPPTFDSDRGKNEFTVRLLLHHFLSEEDLAWLAYFEEHNLAPDEKAALVFVREVGAINNAVYRDLNDQETLKASQHLRRLRDLGLLESRGKSTATYYVPTQALLAPLDARLSGMPEGLSGMPGPLSGMVQPLSGMPEALSGKAPGPTSLEDLPPALRQRVEQLGHRASPEQWKETIYLLCQHRPFSKEDLARLTHRNPHYLQERYISPLLEEGRLERTIPDMPKHPEQAYRATPPTPHTHE